MSVVKAETVPPIVAVYYSDWGLYPRVIGPQVVLAIWSDGRMIGSKNAIEEGPPYRSG
jgi:hypothetical protein